jgi:hypothetical protein
MITTKALDELPAGYEVKRQLDFKKGHLLLIMNILTIPAFLAFGGFFLLLVLVMRGVTERELTVSLDGFWAFFVALILGVLAIVLHELIHGLGFWWFTRSRPKFGANFWGAYAAAPEWYIPIRQHFLIGIAPFVVISTLGSIFIFLVPTSWLLGVLWLMTLNAAGAIGDLIVCFMEVRESRSTLVQDTGFTITVYSAGTHGE